MRKIAPLLAILVLIATGCTRSSGEVWEDTRTAGRHMGQGFRSIGGKGGDSRVVRNQAEFSGRRDQNHDFIPLEDEGFYRQLNMGDVSALDEINVDSAIPLSRENPGDASSDIPGINGFTEGSRDSRYGSLFRNLQFPYNSNLIKGQDNLSIVKGIASQMKADPNLYLFVEGHCDERGAAAYNLALGSRRSNAVRNVLIKEGVDMDNIFTISYGKERPLVAGTGDEMWAINRRAQFRIYHRGRS